MMKRLPVPVILFAGVFLLTLLCQKYILFCQELDGLFLFTGDYFTQMFLEPFPVSGIIGDFLSQMFRSSVYGPLIVAVGVLLSYLFLKGILSRFGLGWDFLCAGLSVAVWYAIATAPSPRRGVAIVLGLFVLWCITRFLPKRENKDSRYFLDLAVSVLLIAAGALFIALKPSLREKEIFSKVKYETVYRHWDKVLEAATPDNCSRNRELVPFALLALGEKGQLPSKMFHYDVRGEDDLDMSEQGEYYESLLFRSALYQSLGCPNEAIHCFSQLSTVQPHGMSFMVLRMLTLLNFNIGNYSLVQKYCSILSRSTFHGQYVKYFRDLMAQNAPREADSLSFRRTVPLITHDPFYNILLLEANSLHSEVALDRVLCTLLLNCNLPLFISSLEPNLELYGQLPKCYEEAVIMAGATSVDVSTSALERYSLFQADLLTMDTDALIDRYGGTYWLYYVLNSTQDVSAEYLQD